MTRYLVTDQQLCHAIHFAISAELLASSKTTESEQT